jgi:hypothetical protein
MISRDIDTSSADDWSCGSSESSRELKPWDVLSTADSDSSMLNVCSHTTARCQRANTAIYESTVDAVQQRLTRTHDTARRARALHPTCT